MVVRWLIFLFLTCTFIRGQTIGNITYTPASPNAGDTISLFCDVAYPNIGCPLTSRVAYQVAGNNVILSAFRCVGMQTMICYKTDTFKIVIPTMGIYNFHYMPGIDTNGTCYKPLYANNQTYQYPSAIKTIQIGVGTQIGINELNKLVRFNLFPNPTTSTLFIANENHEFENSEIEITNYLGKIVLKLSFSNSVDVSKFPQGFYGFRIITPDGGVFNSKFIKE